MTEERRVPGWRYRLRRLFRPRFISFDGLSLLGYGHGIPRGMVKSIARGDYENPERRAVKAILRRNDRVLEIGACMGVVSMTAARIVGAANVVAFEPNPLAAEVARANFQRNGLPVRLDPRAVGAAPGRAGLSVGRGSWLGASIARQHEAGHEVTTEIAPIADLVDEIRPTVLVIDAEGFEAEILPACPLERLRAVVVEFHEDPLGASGVASLRQLLSRAGFSEKPAYGETGDGVSTGVWLREDGASA